MSVFEEEIKSLLGSNVLEDDIKAMRARQNQGDKPQDVHHTISLTLEKIYLGAVIKIRAEKQIPCTTCSNETIRQPCSTCRGSRVFLNTLCAACKGSGFVQISARRCGNNLCKNGQRKQEKYFTVEIPAGARNGEQIRLEGQGDALINKPDTVSDIVCTVREMPHKTFRRCGFDLYLTKSIDLRQSLCGCKFVVQHLDSRKLAVHTKPGLVIKPGEMRLVKNEGMPVVRSKNGAKGDLIIIFNVFFPLKLASAIAEQMEPLLPPKKEFEDKEKDFEEYHLSAVDPSEQVYHVPYRQRETSEESPAKASNDKNSQEKTPSCAQQ